MLRRVFFCEELIEAMRSRFYTIFFRICQTAARALYAIKVPDRNEKNLSFRRARRRTAMQRARFAGSLLTRGVIRVTGADATTFLQVRFVRFVASSFDLDLHSGTDAR